MTECFLCSKDGKYKFHDAEDTEVSVCEVCAKSLLDHYDAIIYKGEIYAKEHPDVCSCSSCGTYIHREQYNIQQGRCFKCISSFYGMKTYNNTMQYTSSIRGRGYYCPNCGCVHNRGLCPTGLQDTKVLNRNLSFAVRNENKSWDPKGNARTNQSYVNRIGQFQTERDLPQEYAELLKRFYRNSKTFMHYYTWEPINIEGEVQYYNVNILSRVLDLIQSIRWNADDKITIGKKIPKYYNYYLKGLDTKGLLTWKFIDIMGNVRERSESLNKFLQEIGEKVDNCNMYCKFKYKLSSDIKHKVDAFKLNEKVGSCQKTGNYDSYARGAYDAVTNGCNCPLLIYTTDDKLIARITTRIMYDKSGQEYILIDRIYHSGEFSDSAMRGEIYKAIVQDLKEKGYKVIASPYSAHDRSTYAYLNSLGMKHIGEVQDLCQPLRRLINNCGYYGDGGTEVLTSEIDGLTWATDYLDKAYLF